MNRKILILLLLLVFTLSQAGSVSAAKLAGTITLAQLPAFSDYSDIDLAWTVSGLPGGATQKIFAWGRVHTTPVSDYNPANCYLAASISGLNNATGTFTYNYILAWDQQTWDFTLTLDDAADCNSADLPSINSVMGSTFIDALWLKGFIANPPSLDLIPFASLPVTCNTFELWGLASDKLPGNGVADPGIFASTQGYSGFESWNQSTTGSFTPPDPLGASNTLLSWIVTFPSTATGNWSFSVNPTDHAGNAWGDTYFRFSLPVNPDELADCMTFSDVSETDTEVYVRYMADLDLAHGYLDGTFRPDTTLTRAEMAAFIELSNGIKGTDPEFAIPPAPGSACDFSDISSDDWFAGWVWQACADGYMNGIGGGLFDPHNFLTRGQVVTVLDNINSMGTGSGYLNTQNVFQGEWGNLYREAIFSDVAVGAFYTGPIQRAYGVGVVDGTSDTTFSPDQAILRGEFIKWMYRTLSRIQPSCVDC